MVSKRDERQLNYCIGLGSNIGERELLLNKSCVLLERRVGRILQISSLYSSEPWGNKELKPFLNMALIIQSKLRPIDLLKICQSIERTLGRKKDIYNKEYIDRPIDIDILLCDQMMFRCEILIIPHPYLAKRKFVLEPLAEIAAFWIHPGFNKNIEELRLNCSDQNKVKRLKTSIE